MSVAESSVGNLMQTIRLAHSDVFESGGTGDYSLRAHAKRSAIGGEKLASPTRVSCAGIQRCDEDRSRQMFGERESGEACTGERKSMWFVLQPASFGRDACEAQARPSFSGLIP